MTNSDAATRFYKIVHELDVVANTGIPPRPEPVTQPGHRYFAAAEAIAKSKAKRALELGYGGRNSILSMAPLCQGEYHIADIIDQTQGMPLPPNVRLHVCNLDNRFPFEDGEFDCVIAMMTIEHLYDPFHALSEIRRVSRAGAFIVINLPNIASVRCRLDLLMGRMPVTSSRNWFEIRQWDGNHLHYFTVTDVKRLATLCGLHFVKLEPVGNWLALKRLMPTLFCHEITFVFQCD